MYELTIRADDELEQFSISGKGTDDKFVTLAIAVAVDSLYRAKCPAEMIGMMSSRDPEVRKRVIDTMEKCILVRMEKGD
uniref:Uncharacterized protein n=1 Tax=Siphoviridae sp. ctXPh6 TaxID=2827578 RepID=A0A8S5LK21_9CAUD|nr:MAG TPA: hypothetical protein [Siphoviridae sp. ctXPh6]